MRQCPTVQRNQAAQNEATRPKKSENQKVPGGARRRQRVPDGARGCQRGQIGTFVAPALGKASQLIVVKVSIAGVEVDALVDTGATTS